jgi:hypothetical protein
LHWIQGKKSHEDEQPIITVKVVAVHDDGRVEIEGDDLKMTLWYHDPDYLRSALCFVGRAEWKPKYHVLCVISSGSFNLATLDKVKPCKPPIHRRPTETTRQFIERAMEENHGYTVPARWLADLDSIPDGDNAEPQSGYVVGIETPTDPTLLEPLRSIQGIWTSPRWLIDLFSRPVDAVPQGSYGGDDLSCSLLSKTGQFI